MATSTVTRGSAPAGGQRAKRKAPFPVELYRSALGKKYVMAVTGIMLMGFVLAHMVGNLKMYLGPAEFDHYGEFLRELLVPILPRTVLLWLLRIGLIGAFALHIHAAYALTRMNHAARSTKYQSQRDYVAANFASRTMRWTGVIFGLFLVWHLFDLSWTGTGYSFHRGAVYDNVDQSLSRVPRRRPLHRGQPGPGRPPVPRRLEPLPVHGLEQPPVQRLAAQLRRRLRRLIVLGNVSFPIAVLAGVVSSH